MIAMERKVLKTKNNQFSFSAGSGFIALKRLPLPRLEIGNVEVRRWIVEIHYSHDDGITTVLEFGIEELSEIEEIVERGPNFYAIKAIIIRIADVSMRTTIEASLRE